MTPPEGQKVQIPDAQTEQVTDQPDQTQAQAAYDLNQQNLELVPEGYEATGQTNTIIDLMYGGGGGPGPNASNPDYEAGNKGQTVGGIGNTDAWGNPINWSIPKTATYSVGDVVKTPAGEYLVVNGKDGTMALMPLNGAASGPGNTFYNLTKGEHHIGINPETGEVWYQQAAGYTNWDQTEWVNPALGGSSAPTGISDEYQNPPVVDSEEENFIETDSKAKLANMYYGSGSVPANTFKAFTPRRLGSLGNRSQQKQRKEFLSQSLMNSLFRDMI